jgi:chitodextrinase
MEGVLDGVPSRSDWLAVLGINFEFLNEAFTSGGTAVEMKAFNFSIEKVGKSHLEDDVNNPILNAGQSYTSPRGQFTLIAPGDQVSNASASYQLQEYPASNSSNEYPGIKLITFRKDAIANNNYELTPLVAGTIIGSNSSWKNGRLHFQGRGQHMVVSDSYSAWKGRTAYYGIRVRRSGRMHYGWGKMRVSSNGTQVEVLEYGINGTPEASIRAGQLFSDDVQDYCDAGATFGPDNIKRVTFANIDRSTTTRPDGGYDNQTDFNVKLVRGESYNLKVDITGNSTNEVYAWFDWNKDKDFNDPNERVQVVMVSGTTIGEATINVPTNATLGSSQLRLRVSRNNNNNPCGSSGTGEVEDYGIFISNEEIPTCEDGIKNGDEVKIDCGGSCEPCEEFTEICDASTTSSTLQINKVEFGSINNTSNHNPYNDFTNQSTNLEKGQATQLTVTLNNQWTPNQVMVWIDWYNDNDFLNTEDVVLKKVGAVAYTASVIPPNDAVVNISLRMRVRAGYTFEPDPCGTDTGIGEVEDYTVTVGGSAPTDTQAPTAPNNLIASNIAQTTLTLNWSASNDNVGVTGYDVYKVGVNEKLVTTTNTTYNVISLIANTAYGFYVVARDEAGNQSGSSNIVNVTTTGDTTPPPPATYCAASGNNGVEAISNVTFAGINNSSTRNPEGYEDFSSEIANVNTGENHNLKVTIIGYNGGSTDEVYAWFDWNNDNDFTDSGEYIQLNKTNGTTGEATINIPQNATLGLIRMRVRVAYNAASNVPCGAVSYGEVEDYSLNISGDSQPNVAPIVSITSPNNNGTFNSGNTISIAAAATDSDGVISKVEFFSGTIKLGEDTTAPYNYNWANVATGNYVITAKATDNDGAITTSSTVNVTVKATVPEVNYCDASGQQGPEAITNVSLFGGINNVSTRNASGYEDFTNEVANLNSGTNYNLNVTIIGYNGGSTDEIYAWFDWNKDGDFEDANEFIKLTKSTGTTGQGVVSVPQNAVLGTTRMRIRVAYHAASNVSCGAMAYGEVEDYTLNISGNTASKSTIKLKEEELKNTNTIMVFPNPVLNNQLNINFNSSERNDVTIELYDVKGIKIFETKEQKGTELIKTITFNRQLPKGLYIVRVRMENDNIETITKIMVK